MSHRQLSARLAEMTEERSLQGFNSSSHSLLCEIEQSMEQEELEQEREQVHTYTSQWSDAGARALTQIHSKVLRL